MMAIRNVYKHPLHRALAVRVRFLREQRAWSRVEMGARAGLHHNYIGYIETAQVNPGLITLHRLAKVFECSVGDLFEPVP
jgi:transcriptional regulator with XRE-family HTH domain